MHCPDTTVGKLEHSLCEPSVRGSELKQDPDCSGVRALIPGDGATTPQGGKEEEPKQQQTKGQLPAGGQEKRQTPGPSSGAVPGPSPWRKRASPSPLGAALPPTPPHCVPALGWRPTVGVAPGRKAWGQEGRHSQQKASSPDSLTPRALCLLGSSARATTAKSPRLGRDKRKSQFWRLEAQEQGASSSVRGESSFWLPRGHSEMMEGGREQALWSYTEEHKSHHEGSALITSGPPPAAIAVWAGPPHMDSERDLILFVALLLRNTAFLVSRTGGCRGKVRADLQSFLKI